MKPRPGRSAALALTLLCVACGGGTGGGDASATILGAEREKPGGGTFLVDLHQGGEAIAPRLAEVTWGRLVDVHALDASGGVDPEPVFRDFVVQQHVLSDGVDFEISTNPLTQRTRLVVLRERGVPQPPGQTFLDVLRRTTTALPPILPKSDDGTSAPPFSLVPRNAALVLRFDDLLEDGPDATTELHELVRLQTGYRPLEPFEARVLFDPSHGGIAGGRFHSTRVIIDLSVSPAEASEAPTPLAISAAGLPASDRFSEDPNVAVRIPTRVSFGSGQFRVLTNLAGRPLDAAASAPFDPLPATVPILRAMRSGNDDDINRGYLFDLRQPEVLGTFPLNVVGVRDDPTGRPGFDFVLDLAYTSPCQVTPRRGDALDLGVVQLELTAFAPAPDGQGVVRDVQASLAGREPVPGPDVLLGSAGLVTPYFAGAGIDPACWVRFDPPAADPPSNRLASSTRIIARFSEPMSTSSLGVFDTFRVARGAALSSGQPLQAQDLVIGELLPTPGRDEVRFTPLLPLANSPNIDYEAQLVDGPEGLLDLAGNGLTSAPPPISFRLDPNGPPIENGGLALNFASADELFPPGAPDLRGQVFLDEDRGVLRPRPVAFGTAAADRSNPLPSIMTPFAPGVQTPLSPLGSKMMTSWRYADFGWRVSDESRYDLDVIGMSWSPIGGVVISDFFPRFEIVVGHGSRVLDEAGTTTSGPLFPGTSLRAAPAPFAQNALDGTQQVVVHSRELGYRVDPALRFTNENGTQLMPFPWNLGSGPRTTFTWRDTSITAQGGLGGVGVPLLREVRPPIQVESQAGSFARAGEVPTVGLPLLWEIRCFPTTAGIGLNPLDISLVFGMFNQLKHRVFSTGGIDTDGRVVTKDPDLELSPTGGFNPGSNPPGRQTPSEDPVFYIGQIDIVIRVSRAHTMWLDTGLGTPVYLPPIVEPAPLAQPPGTSVLVEFRGAHGFDVTDPVAPFNAAGMDAYGDLASGSPLYLDGVNRWSDDVTDADGARFLQIRMSFFGNIQTGQLPELSSVGLAFRD